MKQAYVLNRILVFVFLITTQITGFSQFQPDLLPCDSAYLASIPVMVLSPESAQLTLPAEVDNSSHIYFPNRDEGGLYMYNQTNETASCQSVATVFFYFHYYLVILQAIQRV